MKKYLKLFLLFLPIFIVFFAPKLTLASGFAHYKINIESPGATAIVPDGIVLNTNDTEGTWPYTPVGNVYCNSGSYGAFNRYNGSSYTFYTSRSYGAVSQVDNNTASFRDGFACSCNTMKITVDMPAEFVYHSATGATYGSGGTTPGGSVVLNATLANDFTQYIVVKLERKPTCSFSPSSYTATAGQSKTLNYSTTNAVSATLVSKGGSSMSATVGSGRTITVTPPTADASYYYDLNVQNTYGTSGTCRANVNVSAAATTTTASTTTTTRATTTTTSAATTTTTAATTTTTAPPAGLSCNITASVNPISAGGSTTLTWTTTGATYMWADLPNDNWTGTGASWHTARSGSVTVYPSSTTTYNLQIYNGSYSSCSKTVTVSTATTTTTTAPPAGLSCNITASVNPISAGGSTTLSWTTSGAIYMYADLPYDNWTGTGSNWHTPVSGSVTVYPSSTTTYNLQVYNGSFSSCSKTVTVSAATTTTTTAPPPPFSCNITASTNPISAGGSTTLTWTTSGAIYMYADMPYNNWTGAGYNWVPPVPGSVIVSPSSTTTYNLQIYSATGVFGSCNKTVTVNPATTTSTAPSTYTVNINKTEFGDDLKEHPYGFEVWSYVSGGYTYVGAINFTIPAALANGNGSWTTTTSGEYLVCETTYGVGWTPSPSCSNIFTLNSTTPTVNLNFTNTYATLESHKITVTSGTATAPSAFTGVNIPYEKYGDSGYGTFTPQNASTPYSLPSSGTSTTAFSQVFTATNNMTIGGQNYKFKQWSVTNGDTLLSVENTAESTWEITIRTINNGTTLTAIYEPDFGTYTCIIGAPDKTTVSIGSDLILPSAGYNSPPTGSGYDAKWTVYWGDGTSDNYQSSTLTTPPRHRYTTVGVKKITISLTPDGAVTPSLPGDPPPSTGPLKDSVGWMTELQALTKGYSINKVACDNGIEITVRQRTEDTGGEVAP